ncbi:MAG: 30S ribosome-binding factor RbfA [Tistlia sp.]|uniref:30S ribosome-binding factor RbfA n=1 Tax=Tistlia sp. TaxID=3057121 RepID=UPI0034A1BE77
MTRSRGPKAPTQRQLRVGEELRHLMARLFAAGEAHDPDLADASITVSEVRISPDLKNATVFVLPLAGRDEAVVLAALKRAAPYFRRRLAEQLTLRYTPSLDFQLDRTFDEAERVERLLASERVRRDLQPGDEPGSDAAAGQGAGETGRDRGEE